MATGYVDPNADGATTQFTAAGGGSHYVEVDDGVRQPDTPTGGTWPPSTDIIYKSAASGTYTEELAFTTIASVSSVSDIKVWLHVAGGGTGFGQVTTKVNIYVDGAWQTAQTVTGITAGSFSWKSVTFSGTWDQADIDSLQVRLEMIKATGAYNGVIYVSGLYCEITYTAAGGGSAATTTRRFGRWPSGNRHKPTSWA